ncbi:helix-turn-helix domain-containing protein [Curtobacterium citreum]|uniref:helix-turn-helix domain-containing protein n=1 Tax=Curtobacterium citreum TaxID=2036 RepID=UPI0007368560|nr:helix-turn-helix transcriptional regulator [Curtobacterium citreum]
MGPTGRAVAENLKRIRVAAGMTQAQLAEAVREVGYSIPTAAIGKIETQDRRVDVDDLVVLAVALNVSPLGLLMPWTPRPTDAVEVTGIPGQDRSIDVWRWATGQAPLVTREQMEDAMSDISVFRNHSTPPWLQVLVDSPWDASL